MTMERSSFRSIPAFRELIIWGNSFPVHETITYNIEGSDVLFVMEDFRRERGIIKGRRVGNGFVMLHFVHSKQPSTCRPAPSSLGPRTLKNLELESSRLEASADCRIQGEIYRPAL